MDDNVGTTGEGDEGIATEAFDDLSVPCVCCRPGRGSGGTGRDWTTFMRAWFVRSAAFWIKETSWARLGKIARIRRGVKGIMTSWLMLRNSHNHRREVDC